MNDELTPDERAAMRARIVGGARDIAPAGAHRSAWIAGSVAAVLVVGIAGGVAATSTLSAPPVATTPTVTATATPPTTPVPQPTPERTAAPTPTAPALALGGTCAAALSDDEVSSIVGVPMTLSNGLPADDARTLGGLSCQWRAEGEGYQAVGVAVFPASIVPDELRDSLGVPPDCSIDGYSCRADERFGDAVVSVWGSADAEVTSVLAVVGPRAAAIPGEARGLPAGSWSVPGCEEVLRIAESARGRGDLAPHQGDYHPWGLAWEVMSANGAAGFCALDNRSSVGAAMVIDISFGPGSSVREQEIARRAGASADVPGADAAWYLAGFTSTFDLLVVQSGPNVLTIATGNLTEDEMTGLAAGFVEELR